VAHFYGSQCITVGQAARHNAAVCRQSSESNNSSKQIKFYGAGSIHADLLRNI